MDTLAPAGRLEGLAPPPRALPPHLKADELLGGGLSQVGWIFVLVGSIFGWVMGGSADLPSLWRYHGALEHVAGRSSGCRFTNVSVNRRRVRATDFFFHHGGEAVLGTSYGDTCYEAGQDLSVEFPVGRPDLARVEGLRRGELPPAAGVFILLFASLGLVFVVLSFRQGLRDLDLLSRGQRARASVTGSRPTNMTVNNRRVWEVDLAFKDAFGREAKLTAKTRFPERFEGPTPRDVLYDPDAPERALAVEALEEPLSVDASGTLTSDGWGRALGACFIPALTFLVNAAFLAWLLSRRP